jgi:ABC-type amino acid transport substrate-binding protein
LQVSAALKDYTESHPLLLGMEMDYPPLEYIDENGTPQGLDIVFTKELMKRLDIPFTYSPNTWENISEDVLSGRVDLGMMVYSPYRKNLTNYSRAIFRLYYQILFRKDSKGHFDVRHLAGKKVAYMASRPIKDTLTKVGAILYEVKNL